MEGTPRLKKRMSLTLGRHHKRVASPKMLMAHSSVNASIGNDNTDYEECKNLRTPKSSSITSLNSDGGIECTPPHKKFNLDDSVEYSPKCFDVSFSPGCLLSQTLCSNSPEVGWKWNRRSTDEQVQSATPDSAYAAESSFTSAGSSNTGVSGTFGRTRSDSLNYRNTYEMRREEQRRKLEIQMRRAEKIRADELLKQRCARLQEQMRESEERRQRELQAQKKIQEQRQQVTQPELIAELAAVNDIFSKDNYTTDDFFNDSETDGLLLEASQQMESKIEELVQNPEVRNNAAETTVVVSKVPTVTRNAGSESSVMLKPYSTADRSEKRSSLYMKFLEDDLPNDWFLELDDVILKATQETKPRNIFQRHNSMPSNTVSVSSSAAASNPIPTKTLANASSSTASSSTKIKRHVSSQALRPSINTASSYFLDSMMRSDLKLL
ncbi:uncharacterized protein LOC101451923 isoform X2 [Ceratitis capitata]|uniref:uncharacterized protein LOC101451923 isoform X2 n=1 Tax=Ceratitis capitata TaxID=7213 RepID=UPI0006188CF5|nr:uncharacterized protein LOC101451923 isoform X2 [Ceratitis capitata]